MAITPPFAVADVSAPVPSAVAPCRRRFRRLVRWALWMGAMGVLILAAVWWSRVTVVNYLLTKLSGGYEFKAGKIDWDGGPVLRDLTMTRRADGTVAARVPLAKISGSFEDFRSGRIAGITLERPVLNIDLEQWVEGFRPPPGPPVPPDVPIFVLGHLKIVDAEVTWISGENVMRSAKGRVSGEGGEWRIYPDGSLSFAPQQVTLHSAEVGLMLDQYPLTAMSISADSGTGTISLDRTTRVFTVHDAKLTKAVCDLKDVPLGQPGPPPGPEEPEDGPDTVEAVVVEKAAIDGGGIVGTVLNRAEKVPVRVEFAAADGETMRFLDVPAQIGRLDWKALTAGAEGLSIALGDGKGSLAGQNRVTFAPAVGIAFDLAGLPKLLRLAGVPAAAIAELPHPTGKLSLKSGTITAGPDGVSSPDLLEAALKDFSVELPHAAGSRIAIPSARLAFVPDELRADKHIRLCEIVSPEVTMTTIIFKPLMEAADRAFPPVPVPVGPADPGQRDLVDPWEGIYADRLVIADGKFSLKKAGILLPDVTAGFKIDTAPREAGGEDFYRAQVSQLCVTHPVLASRMLCSAESILIDAHPQRFWSEREIEEIRYERTTPEIHRALAEMIEGAAAANGLPPRSEEAVPADPHARRWRPWRVKSHVFTDTTIRLPDILENHGIEFTIPHLEFKDLPLSAEALRLVDREFEVQVPRIALYSPFTEGFKVAELSDNRIRFTPAGLFNRKLELTLGRPTVYISEQLFNYIDAIRKSTATASARDSAPEGLLAAADSSAAPVQAALHDAREKADERWDIPIFIEAGQLVVALKGHANKSIPVIPFHNALDEHGRPQRIAFDGRSISGAMAVQPRAYQFPEYDTTVVVREYGGVQFNVPSGELNNNLVEVFKNVRLVFRQLAIEAAWLSVTYDENGVYATCGGQTCGGYLNGGVNIYLDEHYSWDAWASLTKVDLKEFTAGLVPEHVTMTGRMEELTVKAAGDSLSLHQLTGSLRLPGAGSLSVRAIDALQKKIAELDPGLSRDTLRIAMESLRDCPYHSGEGKVRLIGREGEISIRLRGRDGARDFTVRLHDYSGRLPRVTLPF